MVELANNFNPYHKTLTHLAYQYSAYIVCVQKHEIWILESMDTVVS